MAFTGELAALGGDITVAPQDEHGHIDLDAALADLPEGTLAYSWGPEPLLTAVEQRCPAERLRLRLRLRLERFAAPVAPVVERTGDDEGFEVECRASGVTPDVGAGTSILEAAEAAGCETRMLEGAPDHRDFLLSEAEHTANASMMICVSRCAWGLPRRDAPTGEPDHVRR
ncbi:flavin reductase family protein [Streptomyces sp. ISL-100]|uniref:flavin reductase family protein n=1 Tax=Streptomyces sp. ISL-100 TaxID=2819173 RepID=UPI0035ABC397